MTRKYIVKQGDNLPLIAQKELGDAQRWQEIAELNDLRYPFVDRESSDGVVSMGKVIKLPEDEEPTIFIEDSLEDSDLLLEYDKFSLTFNNAGEFVHHGRGDLTVIAGLDCLMQDLSNRLITSRGTLPFHPDYGSNINDIIGNKRDIDWIEKARVEILREWKSDDRVVDVRNVKVEAVRDTVKIEADIVTVDGLVKVDFPLPRR